MKSIVLLCLIFASAAAFTRYTALVAEEESAMAQLREEIRSAEAQPSAVALPPEEPIPSVPAASSPMTMQEEINAMSMSHTHEMLRLLERKLDYLEMRQSDRVSCAPALGKVVRLSFSIEPPIEGLEPVSVVTSKQAYSIIGQLESEGGKFAVAAGGDLQLIGARLTWLRLDFDASVEMRRHDADGEIKSEGHSNAQGSTIIGFGRKQELLTVGGSKLMVEAREVAVEEVRAAKPE